MAKKVLDTEEQTPKNVVKLAIIFFCFIVGFFIVIARLFSLQVVKAEEFKQKAKKQHESKIPLNAKRGNIYDRKGRLLATTINSISIAIDPEILSHDSDRKELSKFLGKVLKQPESKYLSKIQNAKGNYVWLVRSSMEDSLKLLKRWAKKGIIYKEEPKRIYPYGSIGSQVLGFTNLDNKGTSGVELGWDSVLSGKNGYVVKFRDALSRLRNSPELPYIPAVDGRSISLTLDIELQRIIELELEKGLKEAAAEAGTVIAMHPKTGEILAMASYPTYDPNNSRTANVESMRNRAITDVYEPGSTFKMITAAAGIEEGVVIEDEMMNGHGGVFQFSSFTIRDVHGMGRVPFREAIHQSSNIILSEVANRIEDRKFFSYVRNFGFGMKTTIDVPGEISGRVVAPEKWDGGTKRFMGHGYALNSTPLQVLSAYSTVANGGTLMKPYIIKDIRIGSTIQSEKKPEKVRRVVSENTAKRITNLFTGVVDSGSGKKAIIKGLKIAGKTGTAQQIVNGVYSKQDYFASFVGYYPAEDPQVAVIVVVDRPRASIYGGASAAPIFGSIASRLIVKEPSFTVSKKISIDSLENKIKDTIHVPCVIGMHLNDAKRLMQVYGLKLNSSIQNGIVFSQFPKTGSKVQRGSTIGVTLTPDNQSLSKQVIRHDVTGLTIRRAVSLLNKEGVKPVIIGKGVVTSQLWEVNAQNKTICKLICSDANQSKN
jgi:cell division protein FtsI (penicillin-binding protein 3)